MINSKRLAVLLGSLTLPLLLSGCTFAPSDPASVMRDFTVAMSQLHSFNYQLDLHLTGGLATNFGERIDAARIQGSGSVVMKDITQLYFTSHPEITATTSGGEIVVRGDLVGTPTDTYFKLADLTLPTLIPVPFSTDSRWYHISRDQILSTYLIPLTQSSSAANPIVEEVNEIITNQQLFTVVETLPEEVVSGQRSFHFKTKIDPVVMNSLITALKPLLPGVKTNSPTLSDYQPELWINKRTHTLSRLKLSGEYLKSGLPTHFELLLDLSVPNGKIEIKAPQTVQEVEGSRLWPVKL